MKRVLILLLLVLPTILVSQRRPKIKGNRSVTEVREQLPPFNAIELVDDLDIELKKSFGEGYEIVADDNLVDVLKLEVLDSTLVISSFYDIVSKKKLEITIAIRELKAITVKEGRIFSETMIESDEWYLNTFGNSELDIDASGFMANINAEDNSSIDLNLDVDSLNVVMKHKTDGIIYAVSGAKKVDLADNASLTLEGTTESLQVDMIANTKLRADKLEAAEVSLSNKESSFARINAYRTFNLKSTGNSKTHLYGNPKITIEEFFDTSQLLKKED
ncbi:MAG: DUF2807 domain-containing protein [Bacteroidota bacterium]